MNKSIRQIAISPLAILLVINFFGLGSCTGQDQIPEDQIRAETELVMRLSKEMVNWLVDSPTIELNSPIKTKVDKLKVTGESTGRANVKIRLIPSSETAKVELSFVGQLQADLKADADIIVAHADYQSDVESKQILNFDGLHFSVADKPKTQVIGQTSVTKICSRNSGLIGRIVRKVARRKIEENKPEIDNYIDEYAQKTIDKQLEKTSRDLVIDLNKIDILDETVSDYFPDLRDDQMQVKTTDQELIVGLGPENARIPELINSTSFTERSLLDLWMKTKPADRAFLEMLLEWEAVQETLKQLIPDEKSDLLTKKLKVETLNNWTVIRIGVLKAK